MAIVTIQVQLPPDDVEAYPPNKLIFITGDKHFADISDVLSMDYIPENAMSSTGRWMRLEASGLVVGEVVDNIKIWVEDVPDDDIPPELLSLASG